MVRTAVTIMPHMTFYVYRMYDKSNQLLYVGRSNDARRRFAEHIAGAPFWDDVCAIGFDRYDTLAESVAAEAYQIWNEEPVHNKVGRKYAPKPYPGMVYDETPEGLAPKLSGRERAKLKTLAGQPNPKERFRRPTADELFCRDAKIQPADLETELPWGEAEKARRRAKLRAEGRM